VFARCLLDRVNTLLHYQATFLRHICLITKANTQRHDRLRLLGTVGPSTKHMFRNSPGREVIQNSHYKTVPSISTRLCSVTPRCQSVSFCSLSIYLQPSAQQSCVC